MKERTPGHSRAIQEEALRYARLLLFAIVVSLWLLFVQGRNASAAFHFAVIDELMTSYNGDANVQFVEIRMLSTSQTVVSNSVLAAFDASGNYTADVLVVPSNLAVNTELRWLMGTTQFQTASGLAPDFIMPAGLPTGGGMICWGAPGAVPPNPPNWDRTVMTNYVDCVAYGTYSGPSNVHIGTPIPVNADGHSLLRIGETNNNAADFTCGEPANPTNHSSASASLDPTISCPIGGIAELPEVAGHPPDAIDSSSGTAGLLAGLAAIAALAVALGGAAWYTRRQRLRKYRSGQ